MGGISTDEIPIKKWTVIDSSGSCPTARSGHSAVVAKESLYIFGGCGLPASKRGIELGLTPALNTEPMPICLGDLHVYDLARQHWSEVLHPGSMGANGMRPAERTCAAMCASEEENRLFLSGGAGDDPWDLRADLLEFDVRRRSWRLLYDGGAFTAAGGASAAVLAGSACRRIGHSMVHDSSRNRLVVFGGSTGSEYFDDTHAFDLATGRWMKLSTKGERPSPRYKHQAFVDGDFMYVIGGGSFEPEGPDLDVYRIHLAGVKALEWERVRPTGILPRCRAAHGLAWDRHGRAAYIWGGFTSDMELDSTFCALLLPPKAPATTFQARSHMSPVVATSVPALAATVVASTYDPPAFAAARSSTMMAAAAVGDIQDLGRLAAAGSNAREAAVALPRSKAPGDGDGADGDDGGHTPSRGSNDRRGSDEGRWLSTARTTLEQQQRPSPREDSGTEAPGGRGRELWQRGRQRLWRQGSGEGGGGLRRHSRRRSWSQGWATGRLQDLWRGGALAHVPPSPPLLPPSPPPEISVTMSSTYTLERSGEGAASSPDRASPVVPSSDQVRNQREQHMPQAGEELSWMSLPNGSELGDRESALYPAGRSFHCAFFHGGACYVTGGSDGARKFGDMWRFPARESPPPLTTLAARAFALKEASRKGTDGARKGDRDAGQILAGLPSEIREALTDLNMQAEAVL